MKKIDKLLLKGFFGPFAVAFGVALFVLIMQFLWLYIDEIAGKGVSIFVMFELLGYLSISVFPMGLAIAVLISSVMVMGGFAERYELSSMKSAGISLMRVMRPLALTAVAVAVFSWVCSNWLIPVANLQFKTRLYDIRKQKPALTLEAGVFNEDFRNFSIRIGKKGRDGETIGNVLIDDNSQQSRNDFSQITADSGRMYTTSDKRFFVMDLHRGTQYQAPTPTSGKRKYPFTRTNFGSYRKVWNMNEFDMNATDPNAFRDNRTMLSMKALRERIDSLDGQIELGRLDMGKDLLRLFEKKTPPPSDIQKAAERDSSISKSLVKKPDGQLAGPPQKEGPKPAPKITEPTKPTAAPPPQPAAQFSRAEEMKRRFADNLGGKPPIGQSPAPNPAASATKQIEQPKQPPPKPIEQPKPLQKAAKQLKPGQIDEGKPDPLPVQTFDKQLGEAGLWLETFSAGQQTQLRQSAATLVNGARTQLQSRVRSNDRYLVEDIKTGYELYLKYCFALVCVVFMFIGAPLGAIIRKGGFGYSVVVAIIFFMVFVTLYITCRKLAEQHVMSPFWAAMTPIMVLAPIALWLTVKAMNDSQIFNIERYQRFFEAVGRLLSAGLGKLKKRKTEAA